MSMGQEQMGSRLDQLRRRQGEGALTEAERSELALLTEELETAEASYLTPATERIRREREAVEAQNRALDALALRKEALVRRLHDFLAEAQAERRAIDGELAAALEAGERRLEADE